MTDHVADLDDHRSTAGLMETEIRRHSLRDMNASLEALHRQTEELEAQLLAERADTWPEAAVKAQYLIRLYARTPEGQDVHRQRLIRRALGDLARLMDRDADGAGPGHE